MTVKRLFFALVSLTLIFSFLVSCADCQNDGECCDSSNEEPTLEKNGYETFFPTEPRDDVSEELKNDILSNPAYTYTNYTEFYNVMPEKYRKKYGIEVFYANGRDYRTAFIIYGGKRHGISGLLFNDDKYFNGITHMAITDINSDGFVELLVAYTNSWDSFSKKVGVLDTRSNVFLISDGFSFKRDDKYVFFKPLSNGGLGVFEAPENDITLANVFFCEVKENKNIFSFTQNEYNVTSAGNYSVNVEFNYDTIHFPVLLNGITYEIKSKIVTTHLGEPYIQDVGYTSQAIGAAIHFESSDIFFPDPNYDDRSEYIAVYYPPIEVPTGEIISRTGILRYRQGEYSPTIGVYDMVITFNGNEIRVPEALVISEK